MHAAIEAMKADVDARIKQARERAVSAWRKRHA
jgi:hypothetical protein